MIEIEYKFIIKKEEIAGLRRKLDSLKFVDTGRKYEKTTMYDNPQELMQTSNGRVRARQTGKSHLELSYKKPLPNDGGPKREIEYEVVLEPGSSPETLVKLLEAMDYHETTSYERYRTAYTNSGGVKLTIDEFPFAVIIEIEGSESEVATCAEQLGFDTKTHINDACDTLFTKWRAGKGLPMKPHMRFEDYDR